MNTSTSYNLHRQILMQKDLDAFLESSAFERIERFLLQLNESVKGMSLKDADSLTASPLIEWTLQLIQLCNEEIDSFPPKDRNADVNRFGNVAFRDWLFALQERIVPAQMVKFVGGGSETLRAELAGYFINSLGSSQRIDYGTGHEVHFLVFMMGLPCEVSDRPLLVLRVFFQYMLLMRKLQRTYWLEPAGSHGVWGLDDYHFLPFLFGAGQLCGHENIRPRAVNSVEMVHYLAPQYIYFDAILNILRIKSAAEYEGERVGLDGDDSGNSQKSALRWMSPVLDDISIVKTWEKVNSGLLKMWKVEVMSKLPIMQHLLFGQEILQFSSEAVASVDASVDDSSTNAPAVHYTHSQRGDCCGNPLPSIYAAESKRNQPGLPFD